MPSSDSPASEPDMTASTKDEDGGQKGAVTSTKIRTGKPVGFLIAGLALLGVGGLALYINYSSYHHPTTDSGTITADVVQIGAEVGGRVKHLYIETNQHVTKGQLLYEIDPEPYQIALRQAEADVALAEAGVDSQKRTMAEATANAQASADTLKQAQANQGLAARTVARLAPLARQSYVSWQSFDQARTQLKNADSTLAAAKQRNTAAIVAIGDLKRSEAMLAAIQAGLARAQYNLRQTKVYAPQDGYVASLEIKPGELLAPHQVLFTLITDSTWYAMANIREFELPPVQPGDCATVYSMVNRHIPMKGTILSIGWGVQSDDYHAIPTSVPYVARQMDWVHVAQRFPVRVRIDTPHMELLRMGATANIEIKHGKACRP